MFNITKYLLKTRDFTKKHFGVSLEIIKYQNDLYKKKWFIITKIVPFIIVKFILDLLKAIYIYKSDDIFYSNIKIKDNFIKNPIFSANYIESGSQSATLTHKHQTDIKDIISKYYLNVPLWFIVLNERFDMYSSLHINMFKSGRLQNKKITIYDHLDTTLGDILS